MVPRRNENDVKPASTTRDVGTWTQEDRHLADLMSPDTTPVTSSRQGPSVPEEPSPQVAGGAGARTERSVPSTVLSSAAEERQSGGMGMGGDMIVGTSPFSRM